MHIVGGTFDENGGKPSFIVGMMAKYLKADHLLNGGTLQDLNDYNLIDLLVRKPQVLIWMPNISNDEEKFLPELKKANPKLLLISSKRVIEKDYKESDVVGRLLKTHSNLGIMITKDGNKEINLGYKFKLLDPLGNQWADTGSIEDFCKALAKRVDELQAITRVASIQIGELGDLPIDDDFIALVREFGEEFTKYVNAVNPNRFLGNAATRCTYGFPGVRSKGRIFVTRRNVHKAGLQKSDFVEIESFESKVGYYGGHKPSVDSPIQLKLFDYYSDVAFMLHGHVYVEGTPHTVHRLPCGSIEEYSEIIALYPKEAANFVVNLSGHGFLALASDLDYLSGVKDRMIARPFPEVAVV
jgi:hypothetical protein